jgi:alkylhydroperoxidase/carboxymuconolactone decarboxylase family protein YurZ
MSEQDEKMKKGIELATRLFSGATLSGVSMPETFRGYTMAHLFGDVWQGDELALEERSLVTCVTLVALNREAEQRLHFVGAKNLGIGREKIEGMISHVAHYAGWPNAVTAYRVLDEVWPVES